MSLNKVILIGNVGKDPDIRYFDTNNGIANFPLATTERGYRLANGTEIPERTEWHNITVRRDLVPFVEKYVKKGSGLYIEGKIRTRSYDDQSGVKRYVTEIYADRVDFYSTGNRQIDNNRQNQTNQQGNQNINIPKETINNEPPLNTEEGNLDDLPF